MFQKKSKHSADKDKNYFLNLPLCWLTRPENATFAIEDETKSLIIPTPQSCFCFHLLTPPCPHQRRVPNLMHPDFCSFSCWPFHFSDGADGLKPWTPYLEPSTLNPFIRVIRV